MEKSHQKKEEPQPKNWLLQQNELPDHYSIETSLEYSLQKPKKKTELSTTTLIQKKNYVAE
jgi:hypothetical protein